VLLGVSAMAVLLGLYGGLSRGYAILLASGIDVVVVALWAYACRRSLAPILSTLGSLRWYPIAVALGCVTFAIAFGLVEACVRWLGLERVRYGEPFSEVGYGWALVFLTLCVQPAVVEELAFRGVILERLRKFLGTRDAVVASALMFMILHLTVLSFPHLLIIGLVLGYLRIRIGSLYPCMVLHFTHNLLALAVEAAGLT
jgi:hypothetical protein